MGTLTSLTTTTLLVLAAVVVVGLVAVVIAAGAVRRAVASDTMQDRGLALLAMGLSLAVAAAAGWALVGAASDHPPAPVLSAVSRLHPQFDPLLDPAEPPARFPPLEVNGTDGKQPGTVVFSTYTTPRATPDQTVYPAFITELDKSDGSIVRTQRQYAGSTMFQPEPDGRYSYNTIDREGENGAGFEVTHYLTDENLQVLESFDLDDLEGGDADLHDFELLDNGNALLLSYRKREVDLTDVGGVADALVWDTVIAERTPAGETVWLWDGAEHMDFEDVPEQVAEQRFGARPPTVIDYAHPNSLEVFDDGDVLVSIRHYDCLYRIDRPTGDIVWTFGGPNCTDNEFTISGDPLDGFSHQHDATILDNGNIMVFDNGNLREDPTSRVLEYNLDEDARTAELVWSYDDGRYTAIMGSGERLANGNTLISWGELSDPAISEVTAQGDVVFEVSTPPGQLVYRAYQGVGGPERPGQPTG